jgi:hypothetical protein
LFMTMSPMGEGESFFSTGLVLDLTVGAWLSGRF